MSKETIQWLNENTMIGYTTDRDRWAKNAWSVMDNGVMKAWWQQPSYNLGYEGAIPVEDVRDRLFNWEPIEAPIMLKKPCQVGEEDAIDGTGQAFQWVPDLSRKAIMHPTSDHVYGYFGTETYQVHGYNQWLINNVANIIDGEIGIASAGLLRNGGVAYVTIELPEGVTTEVAGFEHRPSIVASTSIDGTKATTYSLVSFVPICDNSLMAAEESAGAAFKVKHTSKSLSRISDARDALGLIYESGEKISKFIDSLVNIDVTDEQFRQIISGMAEVPDAELALKGGKQVVKNQRAITIAESKQADLWNLWTVDPRANKWNGTLLGAYQAANTWNEHFRSRNDNQVDRLMTGTLNGAFAKMDKEFWSIVADVTDIDTRPLTLVLAGK